MSVLLTASFPRLPLQIGGIYNSIIRTTKFPILHKEVSPLSLTPVKTLVPFHMLCLVGYTNSFLMYSTPLNIKSIHSLLEYPLLCLAKHCFAAQQYYVSSIFISLSVPVTVYANSMDILSS